MSPNIVKILSKELLLSAPQNEASNKTLKWPYGTLVRQATQSYSYYYKEKVTGSFILRKDSSWKIDKQVATYQAAIIFDLATKLKELEAQVTKTFIRKFLYDDGNPMDIIKVSSFYTENRNASRQYVKLVKWLYLLDKYIFLSKRYVKSFHIGKSSSPHFHCQDEECLDSGSRKLILGKLASDCFKQKYHSIYPNAFTNHKKLFDKLFSEVTARNDTFNARNVVFVSSANRAQAKPKKCRVTFLVNAVNPAMSKYVDSRPMVNQRHYSSNFQHGQGNY